MGKSFHFSVYAVTLFCVALGLSTVIKPSFGDIPTTEVPLFRILNKEIVGFVGGVNITLTFHNYGYSATSGTVWLPWGKVWYGTTLSGDPIRGNISEAVLPFDVNGDGDTSDIFTVEYIDNKTALVDGATVYAMQIPEQIISYDDGAYAVYEKNNFTLGLKTHVLVRIRYKPDQGSGYAFFFLESFFRNHPSPNIQFTIEHIGESMSDLQTAEITNMELNGVSIPFEFNWVWHGPSDSQWLVGNEYVYPLGSLGNGAAFTVKLTITGDPGAYILWPIINWSPDGLHRYLFDVFEANYIPFAITGTAHREVNFEGETYPIDVFTNSTASPAIAFNSTAKEVSFDAIVYSEYGKQATYFWNISIPQTLITGNPWTITIGNETIPFFISTTNGTHTFLYFTYTYNQGWFTTSKISIKGTWAVPEITPNVLLLFFIITTLLASALRRRKQHNLK